MVLKWSLLVAQVKCQTLDLGLYLSDIEQDTLFIVELFYDKGKSHEFLTLSQELAAPGELRQNAAFEFEFKNVEKQYECYNGINVKLR